MLSFELVRGNARECTRTRAFTPGAPPLDLDIFFFSGTCLSNTCFMFIFCLAMFSEHVPCFFFLHMFYVCFAYIDSYEISLFF